jgi:hypothetical protein
VRSRTYDRSFLPQPTWHIAAVPLFSNVHLDLPLAERGFPCEGGSESRLHPMPSAGVPAGREQPGKGRHDHKILRYVRYRTERTEALEDYECRCSFFLPCGHLKYRTQWRQRRCRAPYRCSLSLPEGRLNYQARQRQSRCRAFFWPVSPPRVSPRHQARPRRRMSFDRPLQTLPRLSLTIS